MGLGGGKSSASSAASTKIEKAFSPFFKQLGAGASQAFGEAPQGAFQGQFLAGADPLELQGLRRQAEGLGGFANLGQDVISLGQQTARGDFLSPESNPFLAAQLEQVQRLGSQNLFEQQIPGIRSQAIAQGAFGGTREGITEALAAERSQQAISDAQAGLLAQNFARERAFQQEAGQLIEQGLGLQQLPGALQADVGAQFRQFEQDQFLNELLMFQEQQTGAFRPAQAFGDVLSFIPTGSQTTIRTRGEGGGL